MRREVGRNIGCGQKYSKLHTHYGSGTNDRVDLLYYDRFDYGRAHNSYN